MKILQVNKFLYRRAGAEAHMLDLVELLRQQGNEVQLWGPETPLNFDRREGIVRDIKKFGHMVWSWEAARKFEQVVREFKPEVVHIHNIYHHISPSILAVAARLRVPVVMTVHDWHLINPNYNLFDHGEICERNGWRAIAHRCIKNSYTASLADVLEWRVHKWMRVYERYVAKFVVPNEFVRRKLTGSGIPSEKIIHLPLPVIPSTSSGQALNEPRHSGGSEGSHTQKNGILRSAQNDNTAGGYILYAGRLAVEKGIYGLLEIAKRLPEIRFKIAGAGPEMSGVRCQVPGARNVELLGFVEKESLQELIAGARLVIVPSLWEELSPLSMLEAMAQGKVVVASKIGGITGLIQDGRTGFLVDIRNYENGTKGTKWIDIVQKVYYDEALLKRVGKAAAEYVEKVHDPETHYEKIMEIYRAIRY